MHINDLQDKRVLCIGYSETEIDEYIASHNPSHITALTNWLDHNDAKVTKYPLIVGDITKRTTLGDNAFDAVLTLSVMEHINDLNSAMVFPPGPGRVLRYLKPWCNSLS